MASSLWRLRSPTVAGDLAELIRQAHAQFGERAVVLIDEYDQPFLDNIATPDIARQMRDGLTNLYSVLKGCPTLGAA